MSAVASMYIYDVLACVISQINISAIPISPWLELLIGNILILF